MITCEECGRENDDEYKFCLGCGAALKAADEAESDSGEAEIINCPYCGAEQPSNFKFCGSCGEKIPEIEADADEELEEEEESPSPGSVSTSPGTPGGDGEGVQDEQEEFAREEQPKTGRRHSPTPRGGGASAVQQGVTEPEQAPAPDTDDGQPGEVAESEAPARLVVIRPDGTEGASIQVPEDKLTIGRDSEIEALSGDPFLSPEHASILFEDGDFIIRDEGSLNGIFREVTGETNLEDGDLVRIGQELIKFELYDEDPQDGSGTLLAGSPDSGHWGRLTLVAGPEVFTEAYALDEPEVTIGRESGDILFRDDGFVSGTHAQVTRANGTPILRDLDSSNGTFLQIRDDYQLEDGERVLMGQQLFRLERL